MDVQAVTPTEYVHALTVLFPSLSVSQREAYLASGPLRPDDVLLSATSASKVLGTLRLSPFPGRSGIVFAPLVHPDHRGSVAAGLIELGLAEARAIGIHLVQALLPPELASFRAVFEQAGFSPAAELKYMSADARCFPCDAPASDLEFNPFGAGSDNRLVEFLERTYVGTLDCPMLDGLRETVDVIDGYRQTGVHDPRLWLTASAGSQPVGCLLLTSHAPERHWELIYMGLFPEVRGTGLGLQMARHAQWLAKQGAASQLVLGVDAKNRPALTTYERLGFVEFDQRHVLVWSVN